MSVLIVTGGGSGIGLACLEEFLESNKENKATLVDRFIDDKLKS